MNTAAVNCWTSGGGASVSRASASGGRQKPNLVQRIDRSAVASFADSMSSPVAILARPDSVGLVGRLEANFGGVRYTADVLPRGAAWCGETEGLTSKGPALDGVRNQRPTPAAVPALHQSGAGSLQELTPLVEEGCGIRLLLKCRRDSPADAP